MISSACPPLRWSCCWVALLLCGPGALPHPFTGSFEGQMRSCPSEGSSITSRFALCVPKGQHAQKELLKQWVLSVTVSSKTKCEGHGRDHIISCPHWLPELGGGLEPCSRALLWSKGIRGPGSSDAQPGWGWTSALPLCTPRATW